MGFIGTPGTLSNSASGWRLVFLSVSKGDALSPLHVEQDFHE